MLIGNEILEARTSKSLLARLTAMIRRFPVGTAKFLTSRFMSTTQAAELPLLSEKSNGGLLQIVLNRPKALNALTLDMCQSMNKLLTGTINVPDTTVGAFLVKGAGGKAFCAGGDVKSIWQDLTDLSKATEKVEIGTGKPGVLHTDFFRDEYIMNYMLAESLVPQVSIWDGFVMGGGVGISIFGEFRIATEKAVFAMPETGTYHLSSTVFACCTVLYVVSRVFGRHSWLHVISIT